MKWLNTSVLLALAFGTAFVIILMAAYLSLNNLTMLKSSHASAQKREEIIDNVERLLYAVKDAEANSRAYIITKQERFLNRFDQAPASIKAYEANLRILLAGEKDMEDKLNDAERLIFEKMTVMQDRVRIAQTAGLEAIRKLSTGKGVILMDEIADLVRIVVERERLLLSEDNRRGEREFINDSYSDALLVGVTSLVTILFFFVANRQVTRRAESETALQVSENRFLSVIENSLDTILVLDLEGKVLYVNPAGRDMLGRPDQELIGLSCLNIVHPDDKGVAGDSLRDLIQKKKKSVTIDLRIQQKGGTSRWVEARKHRVRFEHDRDVIIANYRDVTDRKSAELALQQSEERYRSANERLEGLSKKLLEVQETERRQLAVELHDEIGQLLTAVQMNLRSIQRFNEPATYASRLDESLGLIERLLEQVRNLSLDLRPWVLDHLGLVPALRWYIDRQSQRGKIRAKFGVRIDQERFPPELETVCFRLVQEAMTNVLRHSHASEVEVDLRKDSTNLILTVKDNGTGFNVEELRQKTMDGSGFGILGMKERVSLIGGSFEIQSTPGKGTHIVARVPMSVESISKSA